MKSQLFFGTIFLLSFNILAQVPTISSFTPTSGPIGTAVTITGTNFDPTPANNSVYFGAIKVTPSSGNATSLTVTVPPGATSIAPIVVQDNTTGLVASSLETITGTATRQFTVTNTPTLSLDYLNTDVAVGNFPKSVAIGDFDGAGNVELNINNFSNDDISLTDEFKKLEYGSYICVLILADGTKFMEAITILR